MLEKEKENNEYTASEVFNFVDGDVTIYSSDKIKFKITSGSLQQSKVFKDMLEIGNDKTGDGGGDIHLSELGKEVEIMLRWIYPSLINDEAQNSLSEFWFWRMCDKYELILPALQICAEIRAQYHTKEFSVKECLVHLAFESTQNSKPLRSLATEYVLGLEPSVEALKEGLIYVEENFVAGFGAVERIVSNIKDQQLKIAEFSRTLRFTPNPRGQCADITHIHQSIALKLAVTLSQGKTEDCHLSFTKMTCASCCSSYNFQVGLKVQFIKSLPSIV